MVVTFSVGHSDTLTFGLSSLCDGHTVDIIAAVQNNVKASTLTGQLSLLVPVRVMAQEPSADDGWSRHRTSRRPQMASLGMTLFDARKLESVGHGVVCVMIVTDGRRTTSIVLCGKMTL